ncbi:hypothetical protein F5B17DRAFT_410637 [Nemania serpens]|nr:hypothetical protein F5B17DRAFT_410637 [Nemania serpens]
MQPSRPHTQGGHRGVSWAQYAHRNDMAQFGTLRPTREDKKPPAVTDEQNPNNKKQAQETLPRANKADDQGPLAKPAYTGRWDRAVALRPKKTPSTFGNPSPVRYGPKKPLWIRDNAELTEELPYPKRALDELYVRHPEKKLQAIIGPSTIKLAAGVILQVVNESAYQWFNKWCPGMDLRDVFENIRGKGEDGQLVSKQYTVPPEAIDTSKMATSLGDMYRRCRNIYPKDSGASE